MSQPQAPTAPSLTLGLLQQALDSLEDAFVLVGANGQGIWCNAAFAALTQQAQSDIVRRDIARLLPMRKDAAVLPRAAHPLSALLEGKTATREVVNLTTPSGIVTVEVTGSRLMTEHGPVIMLGIRDLPDQFDFEQFQLYQTALITAPYSIIITDADMRIIWVNPMFTETTGYGLDEVFGTGGKVLRSPEHDEEFYQGILSTIRSGGTWTGEIASRRKDGGIYHEEQTIVPMTNALGEPSHYIIMRRNITRQKLIEMGLTEREERYSALFRHSNDGIIIHTPEGEILDVNVKAQDMFGYSRQEMIRQHVTFLSTNETKHEGKNAVKHVAREGSTHFETQLRRKDGTTFWAEITANIIEYPSRQVVQGIIRDVTHSRLIENDLRHKQARLEEDLRAAAEIQKSLIPPAPPQTPFFDIHWNFMPSEHIGGDIFDIVQLDDEHYAFYVLDVSGHGVPAALVAVSVSQVLEPQYLARRKPPPQRGWEILPPAIVMDFLDRQFPMARFGNRFFTILYMVLNIRTGTLRYSVAGHPPPIVLRADGSTALLDKGGPLIGLSGALPFTEGEITLAAGDRIAMYSDGITEHQNAEHDFYEMERFTQALTAHRDAPLPEMVEHVVQDVMAFGDGVPLRDDLTLVLLDYNGSEESTP
ncbi:SpoIIE family protein phosphatase [Desulfobaculum sp.]